MAAAPQPRHPENTNPVDAYIGARLRLRRSLMGMSQGQLGQAVNLTFQQIQKYENGTNRISASRLFELGQILNAPVAYFFEGVASDAPPAVIIQGGVSDNTQQPLENTAQVDGELLRRRETLKLIRAYYHITDPKQRRKVYELIKTMAE